MKVRVSRVTNATRLTSVKFWLIKKIAGNLTVVINAKFKVETKNTGLDARIENLNGGLVERCCFVAGGPGIVVISSLGVQSK